jgi:hypothetical protein
MGTPFLYQLTVTALASERWKVELDFRGLPDGVIAFACNDLALLLDGVDPNSVSLK